MDYTTELSAVNSMLATIGEAPINSLDSVEVVDAVTAIATLQEVTRSVLVEGWAFNTDTNFPFAPSGAAPYEITLPGNAMSVLPCREFSHIIVRGGKLYDSMNHSFSFQGHRPVPCDVIWAMDFQDLPEVTRQYVTVRAARMFQARAVASDLLHAITESDERVARWNHRKQNIRVRRKAFLQDSYSVRRVLAGR